MLRLLGILLVVLVLVALGLSGGALYVLYQYGRDLPDYQQLADYEPPTVTRVHAGDGRLLAEYAREKRMFVPISAMPKPLIHAFLSAEDKSFYSHPGVDAVGVLRAVVMNLKGMGRDRRPVGGSTITQQVAKNFLLSNEVTLDRKIKEAILAFRIERAFTKDRILELYLNEIYLGLGSYGVAAAALNYFNKSLDELTLPEASYLAALPKAPNNYHPLRQPEAAVSRRNWVIERMREDGYIEEQEAELLKAKPLTMRPRSDTEFVRADYFTEEVRREMLSRYGETALYEGGLSVRTTLDPHLQAIAERALKQGLIAYDRRHGWRGPLSRIPIERDWAERLSRVQAPVALDPWRLAVVLALSETRAEIGLANGARGYVPFDEMKWARPWREDQRVGGGVDEPDDVVEIGDVIAVEALSEGPSGAFGLRQIPEVDGALIAIDPHTGRVLAMVGGYSMAASQFNRATQALRQPGSAFKAIVYTAALENGFTPSSLILDGPFVIDQGSGLGKWKPANYTRKFYGPSTLRLGIEKSRNLMTVRLAQHIGMEAVAVYAQRLGVVDDMPRTLAMALGASETTLLRLTTAYAMLVNGGKRITPTLIDRIQDRRGRTIYRHDRRPCAECRVSAWEQAREPRVPDDREQVLAAATAYQMVSLLQGVVQRGTGRGVKAVGKPIAGKTGTTNDNRDSWFIGFSPDLAAGVYVGFDAPRTLGRRETGASVAAPLFRDFMAEALRHEPAIPFRVPPGVRLVRVDPATGLPAGPAQTKVILEAFKLGTEPSGERTVLDGSGSFAAAGMTPRDGTGGLY